MAHQLRSKTAQYSRQLRRLAAGITSACLCTFASSIAHSCDQPWVYAHEQAIVRSILNLQSARVERLLDRLNPSQALIPEADFYRGLAIWYGGYQENNRTAKKRGIKSLLQSVKSVQQKYSADAPGNDLIIGLVKGYTARALLENEQIIRGYDLGSDAVVRLERFVDRASPSTPGYHDATFLLGLYYVYTHDLKTRSHWFIGTVDKQGNRDQGISWIKQAIRGQAVFSMEAVRALLAEVSWRTPDVCRLLDLSLSANDKLPFNADLALIAQGLLLKCGSPATALDKNNWYRDSSDLNKTLRLKMLKARLRILADLGRRETLNHIDVPSHLEPFRSLALANAMDVRNERELAEKRYRQLRHSRQIPEAIQKVAEVRLRFPYRAPLKRVVDQDHFNTSSCASE